MDQLGLAQGVERLGEGVVVTVTARADRRHGAGIGQPLGVADGEVLDAAIAVADEAAQAGGTASQRTISGASGAGSVRRDLDARQPTTKHEQTSTTNAT